MSNSEGIPIRHLVVNDPKDMPLHYGETPGGSIYSTTPGGSRIYYDRTFLLSRRESPMTRSPPFNLPFIPEVTLIPEPSKNGNVVENGINKKNIPGSMANNSNVNPSEQKQQQQQQSPPIKKGGDDQFSMDI